MPTFTHPSGNGYTETEFFLTGRANTYLPSGPLGLDGKWNKVVDRSQVPYTTRFIVDRPADPARFNGIVWVEWLNVTAGSDLAASVVQGRDHIVATGAAWIGVSAQSTGVNAPSCSAASPPGACWPSATRSRRCASPPT